MSDRYARQTVLPQIGPAGQARLGRASVAVVGAGGLGCALLPYLAAAGVGRLEIVDHDRVEESNLHRQPLYRMSDLGQPKVLAARASLVGSCDVVIDAADSFAVTYVLSDACERAGKPLVSASVLGLSGYVGAFCGGAPSYRAVFPELPPSAGSCAASGVLGTAVAVIGTLQAHLTLAILLAWEPSVLGRLIHVDFRSLHFGGFSFTGARAGGALTLPFIAPAEVAGSDIVIDLRGIDEAPQSPFPRALRLGVEALESAAHHFPPEPRIVLCCRSGVRAWRAARALEAQGHRNLALIALGA